ncbi:putative sulfate exporter family transporter [Paenibacillus pasadenensis]|nr:putative sulfate exporter family transporter [Paenibacillus pasadenensis]MCM3748771.1 putative sulfate exporter family transporter [Paenibacillus pasadenensis]
MTQGIVLTVVLAAVAGNIAKLPFFSIMGVMIISIVLGVFWKSTMDIPQTAGAGITFSSKYLLRAGIILMGLRLNLSQILDAGLPVLMIDIIVITFTLAFMIYLGRKLAVDTHLSALIAVGTAICGAAAIVAVAPLIGARKELTAISVACIAILGTIGSLAYIFLYPYMGLEPYLYGVLAGSTLHELAHVIAAGAPAGAEGSNAAIVVKLGRVALLIPVALVLGYLYRSKQQPLQEKGKGWKSLPIPWFIFGFLAMSIVNTTGVLPAQLLTFLVAASVFLLSAAMAGLGLSIKLADFKKVGKNAIIVAVAGFVALAIVGQLLIMLFY